ncbi:MAG: ATP-binding protein [Leptospira sp.]|nr:ATP-binding protein [Leptospira sp.]
MKDTLKSFLDQLFTSSDVSILLVDSKSFKIIMMSDSLAMELEYQKNELESFSLFDLLLFGEERHSSSINSMGSLDRIDASWEFLKKDKSIVPLSFKLTKIPNPEDPIDFIFYFQFLNKTVVNLGNQDIHFAKEAETLRTIIATMNNGIVMVDDNGIIQEIAPIFKFLLFQYLPLEKGDFIFSFLEESLQKEFLQATQDAIHLMETKTKEFNYTILESEYNFIVRFIPIRRSIKSQKIIMLVFTDQTETKRLDRQLIESMKFVSIGEIAAGLAHEINNPLQSALLYLDDLILIGEDDPVERKAILKKIESANLRIRDLVRSLLDLGRVESQTRDLVSPYYILVRASELVEVSCKKKGIEFVRHAGPNLPGIIVRWQEIEQVLINCVVNAINAISEMESQRQSPKIEIGIDLITSNKKDWVVFSIEDNGPGMNDTVLDKAFLPLFTTRRDKQGTGLGLSISKKIINDHDGEILIKSKYGVGTKIEIYLPAQLDKND